VSESKGDLPSFFPASTTGPRLRAGVDIIEIERIRHMLDRYGQRFLQRVYTADEAARYGRHAPELAARFAGKEAVSKALGTGFAGVAPREIEILSDPRGKPVVHLWGRAQARARELGLEQIEISLSHSEEYAVAFVIAM
jgi:holo-[acyl-carrier protein] synthase